MWMSRKWKPRRWSSTCRYRCTRIPNSDLLHLSRPGEPTLSSNHTAISSRTLHTIFQSFNDICIFSHHHVIRFVSRVLILSIFSRIIHQHSLNFSSCPYSIRVPVATLHVIPFHHLLRQYQCASAPRAFIVASPPLALDNTPNLPSSSRSLPHSFEMLQSKSNGGLQHRKGPIKDALEDQTSPISKNSISNGHAHTHSNSHIHSHSHSHGVDDDDDHREEAGMILDALRGAGQCNGLCDLKLWIQADLTWFQRYTSESCYPPWAAV